MLLGRYRIERALGEGGMGQVYLALDHLLDRRVALKRMLSASEDRAHRRKAVLKEARRASRINSHRIASIHDVLDLEDEVVLVMEYVDGVTLRERMATPVSLDGFWNLALQCVEGVADAHAHGVIHRDIKPENLMVTGDGEIKILDFGIARRSERATGTAPTLTATSMYGIAGTPQYMAPEAHLGGTVNERTDIFSLGVVFYELLTTKRPFEGPTYAAVVDKVLHTTPPPVLEQNPAAGPELSRVVAKMLARDPSERFASAPEVLRALTQSRLGAVDPASTRAASPAPAHAPGEASVPTPAARNATSRARVAALALGVAIVAAGAIWWRVSVMTALPANVNVAVIAPATPGAESDFASFALGSVYLLSARLQRLTDHPGFQIASLSNGLTEKVRSPTDARKLLGANVALVSTLERSPDELRARLQLVETGGGRVLAARSIRTPLSEPFAFLDHMSRDAFAMLGLGDDRRDSSPAHGVHGAGTLRFYVQGLGRMLAAASADDARRAVADLELACRTESDAAAARGGLAAAQLSLYSFTHEPEWLADAEASSREAIRLDDSLSGPHRTLGSVFSAEKNAAAAVTEFTRASELDPTDDVAPLFLGKAYGRLGQKEKEKEVYLAAIQRRPHCWQPHWWLAVWNYRKGNVDAAIRGFETMIRCAPLLANGYSSLGGLLVVRGDYGNAIDTLKASLALRPTAEAFTNLGTAYFNSGRFDEAVDAYNQSFQFGFTDFQLWVNLGDARFWQPGHRDQAAEAYAQAIRLGRDELLARSQPGRTYDITIAANLATVFGRLGQPDSARHYLGQALRADSANSMVQYYAALAHWQLGERDRALTWLTRSVEGGYPTRWLRDSPMFRDWREVEGFRALIGKASPAAPKSASGN